MLISFHGTTPKIFLNFPNHTPCPPPPNHHSNSPTSNVIDNELSLRPSSPPYHCVLAPGTTVCRHSHSRRGTSAVGSYGADAMNAIQDKCRPKHQVLVLKCYPRTTKGAVDVKPNSSELSYLLFYATSRRSKIQKIGSFLEKKTASDVWRVRIGYEIFVTIDMRRWQFRTKC